MQVLGEHTEEILTQLGIDDQTIAQLEAEGAIKMWRK
jgi:crotonobetainyl-CoA:carnitine CoA-transferase CaiB-like acyl-CoA transferase